MSSIFKTNSRFAVLSEDISTKKEKREKSNRFNSEYNSFKRMNQNEMREVKKKEEQEKALRIENFPELVLNKKELHLTQEQHYLDKVKIEKAKDEDVDINLNIVKPGWVLLKKDELTSKTIVKPPEIIKTLDDKDLTMKTMNALSELHETRTQQFIELNDYDVWEKMFKSNGWMEWEQKYAIEELDEESELDEEEELSEDDLFQ
jgi:hypothetical protein